MKSKILASGALAATTAVAVVAPGVSVGATPSADAALREFEGTVVSKSSEKRTFRLRDSERGTVRIRVTRNTAFERIDGFSGLTVGARNIEATVRRSDGRWIAARGRALRWRRRARRRRRLEETIRMRKTLIIVFAAAIFGVLAAVVVAQGGEDATPAGTTTTDDDRDDGNDGDDRDGAGGDDAGADDDQRADDHDRGHLRSLRRGRARKRPALHGRRRDRAPRG